MANNSSQYSLRYLPLFYDDMGRIIDYISDVKLNPAAASNLLDSVGKAILERLPNAESFEQYHSPKEHKYPYYRIYVENYIVYYVVIPEMEDRKVMEVRRILHRLQNRSKYI